MGENSYPDGFDLVQSKKGWWTGSEWVADWQQAQKYPPCTLKADAVCDEIAKTTGVKSRVWYSMPTP